MMSVGRAARSLPADRAAEHTGRSRRRRGFRPASRRRHADAARSILAAVAIGGNVLVYSALDDKTEVLQVTRDVPAGEMITAADLRIVEVDVDPSVPTVSPADIGRCRQPLRACPHRRRDADRRRARAADASRHHRSGRGRGRDPADATSRRASRTLASDAHRGVGRRRRPSSSPKVESSPTGRGDGSDEPIALSVEVRQDDAATIAAASEVRVALLDPGTDPAVEGGA